MSQGQGGVDLDHQGGAPALSPPHTQTQTRAPPAQEEPPTARSRRNDEPPFSENSRERETRTLSLPTRVTRARGAPLLARTPTTPPPRTPKTHAMQHLHRAGAQALTRRPAAAAAPRAPAPTLAAPRPPLHRRRRHLRDDDAAAATPPPLRTAATDTAATAAPPATSSSSSSSALYHLPRDDWARASLSVVVVGASGDLAKKKIFPALFALYYEGLLPRDFQVFGYARSGMTDAEFRDRVARTLACRVSAGAKCAEAQEQFLQRCFYVAGPYDAPEGFQALDARMAEQERSHFEGHASGGGNSAPPPPPKAHRMFFLSIPPSVFTAAAGNAAQHCSSPTGWTRVIVEKPFGRDAESSAALGRELGRHLSEEQIYRIDHYLGKELIENLTVLRFSNLVFEPLWSRQYIRNVQVIFSEDFGTEGR